jgi:N-acetyl-gamma-glutamyl-phosphate reductase
MRQVKVGIINITGYTGAETARLLFRHPGVQLVSVTGRTEAGKRLREVFPYLAEIDLTIQSGLDEVDLVFSALPHKASAEAVLPLLRQGVRVIDLSADFRLKQAEEYPRWYDFTHPAPQLLQEAVYGLPELHRAEVSSAHLVANPGCYPTGAILALAPAIKEGLIEPDIIIDSKSGVSGAGRTLSLAAHYCEANENVSAYALEGHRHLPEILQELHALRPGLPLSVTFLPHLVPMSRGILSSCYAPIVEGKIAPGEKGKQEVALLYTDFYRNEPFVKVVETPPQTKHTWGNNFCLIYPTIDLRTGRLMVISCLDNLVKGAAGQAIQNMNLMLGFPETLGLEALAVYP